MTSVKCAAQIRLKHTRHPTQKDGCEDGYDSIKMRIYGWKFISFFANGMVVGFFSKKKTHVELEEREKKSKFRITYPKNPNPWDGFGIEN